MKIYIPYYENCSWHTATLNSLDCNLYKHKGGGYTIFAYNNAVAYNGNNIYSNELGATSDTLAEIQLMETVKSSLDFLVRGVLK